MTWTIHKGKHKPSWWWLRWPLWFNKRTIKRKVTFSFSSKYDIGQDQEDHNKLFGIGYLWSPHKDSARFGWRYDNKKNKFIISAYCYVNGQRIMENLCEVVANHPYTMTMYVQQDYYRFMVEKESGDMLAVYSVPFWHNKKISYPLGLYFGGNKKAPNQMTIEIKKV
jgi:hypothetical protein